MNNCLLLSEGLDTVSQPITLNEFSSSHHGWAGITDLDWDECNLGKFIFNCASLPAYPSRIFLSGTCTSSLDIARKFNEERLLNEWDSILALKQKSGRGQLRREWDSPEGNIYGAINLPVAGFFSNELGSLAIGFLLSSALAELGYKARIKWPNDILIDDYKVGGILLEERAGALVAGIGLNVHSCPPPAKLRNEWAVPAGCLCKKEQTLPILQMWQTLVDSMHFCYNARVVHYTTAELISSVEKQLAWLGREVWIHGSDLKNQSGRVTGISQDGGLRILQKDGEKTLHSGSISLRS